MMKLLSAPSIVVILVIAGALGAVAWAQSTHPSERKHRVLFELTSDSPEQWDAVLNNIENLRNAFGAENTQVELVVHGPGLGMLLPANEKAKDRMRKLAGPDVIFVACENTMKRKNVKKDDLLDFVTTVDSGVAEVVRRQEQGWSYIKSGH